MSEDIAWAAGLFEGEGCMSTFAKTHLIRATVSSMDREVLDCFQSVVGVGRITRQTTTKDGRVFWRWSANMEEAADVMRLFLPYMGVRRQMRALQLLNAREQHIAAVTHERQCPGCGVSFRPPYSANSGRQTHCARTCYDSTTGRRRRKVHA